MTTYGASPEVRLLPGRGAGRRFAPRQWARQDAAQLGLAAAVSVGIGLMVAVTGGWKLPAALLAMVALIGLGMLRPKLFLCLFILLRPLVALVSSKQLVHGVPSANANGLTGMVLLVVVVSMLFTSRSVFKPRVTKAFVMLLTASAVGAAYALLTLGGKVGADPISELVRLTSLFAIYLLAANLFASVAGTQLVLRLIALSGVAPAIYGVVEWVSGAAPYRASIGVSRISSTLGGGTNTYAAYLAPCALVMIAGRTGLPRWVRWPSAGMMLAALIGTYSREGWLIFLVGILVLGWKRQRALAFAVLACTALLVFTVPTIHDRVLSPNTKTSLGTPSGTAYSSFQWRLQNWGGLVDKFAQSPLIGYGLGSEVHVNPYQDPYAPGLGWNSHNSGLTILIEGGVVLLIFWIGWFTQILRTCSRLARSAWEQRQTAALALALWISVITAGLITEDTLNETSLIFILLALTGSLEGAWRSRRVLAPRARSDVGAQTRAVPARVGGVDREPQPELVAST